MNKKLVEVLLDREKLFCRLGSGDGSGYGYACGGGSGEGDGDGDECHDYKHKYLDDVFIEREDIDISFPRSLFMWL